MARRTFAPLFKKVRRIVSSRPMGQLNLPRTRLLVEELEPREVLTTINLTIFNNSGFADSQVNVSLFGTNSVGRASYVNLSSAAVNPVIDSNSNQSLTSAPFAFATTLTACVTASATFLPVASTQGNAPIPLAAGINIKVGNEVMTVANFTSTGLNVIRGIGGTTPAAYNANTTVNLLQYVPNYTLTSLANYSSTTHSAQINLDANVPLISARMFFGMGNQVISWTQFGFANGLPTTESINGPSAQTTQDFNRNIYWDFAEPNLSNVTLGNAAVQTQLVLDTTQVDAFGFPITIQTNPTDPAANKANGSGIPGVANLTRVDVVNLFGNAVANTAFATSLSLAPQDQNGNSLRILNPASVLAQNPITYGSGLFTANANVLLIPTAGAPTPQVGSVVVGNGIATGTTVTAVNLSLIATGVSTTTGNSSVTITGANTSIAGPGFSLPGGNQTLSLFYPGMPLNAAPFAAGTTVQSVGAIANGSVMLTLSNTATSTNAGNVTLTFLPNSALLSANATANSGNGTSNTTPLAFVNNSLLAANSTGLANNVQGLLTLSSFFDGKINTLFTNGTNLTLTVPNPGAGQGGVSNGDGSSYTFVGTFGTRTTLDVNGSNQTYQVLQFQATGNIAGLASPTFYVYKPFFSTNTPGNLSANLPPPPAYFTNSSLGQLSLTMTPGEMVFGSGGTFADNNLQWNASANTFVTSINGLYSNLQANVENQIVSALNRGMTSLGNTTTAWSGNSSQYYGGANQSDPYNAYAAFLHSSFTLGNLSGNIAIDKRAYGFAFDDQNGCDTALTSQPANTATITLGAWNLFTPPSPPTVPTILAVGTDAGPVATVVVSNANGTPIANITPFGTFTGGVRVAVGDVNNDGFADIIAGAGPGGESRVVVISGEDYSTQLMSFFAYSPGFSGGVYVAAGNLDGDANIEIITGAGPGGAPHVAVFDFASGGTPVSSFYAYAEGFTGGVTVAAGNVDGVGTGEIITGVAGGGSPHVKVFQLNGTLVSSFYAFNPTSLGGIFVAAGDLDGDGVAEIIVGPNTYPTADVNIFDVTTSVTQPVSTFRPYSASFTGGVRVGTFDVDNDQLADIVTGPGPGGAPNVKVYNGSDLALLQSYYAVSVNQTTGIFVS